MAGRGIGWLRAALAAVYLLVLQPAVAALAHGNGPHTSQLDAFGNPLCGAGASHSDTGDGGGDHRMLPDCCMFGCRTSSPLSAVACEDASLAVEPVSCDAAPLPSLADIPVRAGDYDPGNPRAPPPTA